MIARLGQHSDRFDVRQLIGSSRQTTLAAEDGDASLVMIDGAVVVLTMKQEGGFCKATNVCRFAFGRLRRRMYVAVASIQLSA